MRLNKYVALSTGMSRRSADDVIAAGQVLVNEQVAEQGYTVQPNDTVLLDGKLIAPAATSTLLLNKPVGYVCSRDGQGSRTIYDILPREYHHLKPVGRLDKDSSGLLLLTNDGGLANELTHPSHRKAKVYEVSLNQPLQPLHRQMISDYGVQLDDGSSKFELERQVDADDIQWIVTMSEGRNRQIRRTFAALGYTVTKLHRTHFGPYSLENLTPGQMRQL